MQALMYGILYLLPTIFPNGNLYATIFCKYSDFFFSNIICLPVNNPISWLISWHLRYFNAMLIEYINAIFDVMRGLFLKLWGRFGYIIIQKMLNRICRVWSKRVSRWHKQKKSASFYAGRPIILDCKSSPEIFLTNDYLQYS